MDPGESFDRTGQPQTAERGTPLPGATETAQPDRRRSLAPRAISATFTPAVIEDIQIKAELARYRIRGFGSLRPRTWATFDDLTFIPATLTRIPLEGYREACSTRTVLGTRFASQADRARHPADGHRHELRGTLTQRQDGPGARRTAGRHLHHHRRRRHARRRAHRVAGADLRGPAQPLRHQHPAPAPGRRHRADDRPGSQARDRRPAAGLEGLRRDRRGSAICRPASISARPAAIPISSAPTT